MNFQELAAKLKNIEEGSDAPVEECGEMPMAVMHSEPPKQQDNVTMNVSMNGQGPNGIKDLMSILRNIENGGNVDAEPEMHDEPLIGSAEPMSARGGCGDRAPYRACVGSTREGDVDPPAGRSGGESRAVSEQEKTAGSSNRGSPGPVDFAMYSSAFFRVWRISSRQHGSLYRLRLSLSPRGVNTRNMAESDCVENCGSGGRRSMTIETPTL